VAIEANVVEDFSAFTRAKKGQEPEAHQFKKGDKVSLLQAWKGDLCLIKDKEGKVFNIKKTYLNKEVFEKGADQDKGKTRKKRSGDLPDYAGLSEIRPELAIERGLAPSLSKSVESEVVQGLLGFFRSKSGATITLVVVVLAVYLGWINLQKNRNRSPYGQLAVAVLEKGTLHEPGHFEPSYRSLTLDYNGSKVEARVEDSIWSQRILKLRVPGKKPAILATEQEKRWLFYDRLKTVYYDEFVDEGSDGEVDKVLNVLEFWSDSDKLIGAYRKPAPEKNAYEQKYQQSVNKIVKSLFGGN
jgi:hypothetical protein